MTTTFCLQLLLGAGVSPSGFQVSRGFLMGKIRESVRAQLQTTGSTRARFRRKGFMMRDEVAHEIVGRKGRRRRFRLSSQDGPAPAPLGLSREAAAPARSRQSGKPPLLPTGAPRRPHGRPQRRAGPRPREQQDGLRPREPPFRAGRRTGGSGRANPRSHPERGGEGGGRCRVGLTLSARREGILQGACFLGDG